MLLKTHRRYAQVALVAASILGFTFPAQSGLLTIATEPLGTSTSSIKPNIMFILDSSGSMGSDYMPDYVNDGHNPPSSTAACHDAGDDSTGTITGGPDACILGDPPYMSPDLNGMYYNPDIRYRPGANYDGSNMMNQDAASTSNWTAVQVDPYTTAATTNLAIGYPDRVWCISQADAASGGNCRQNTAYQYPDATFPYGLDSNAALAVKYVYGSPYFYRMQSAQYCATATSTNCKSGSSIDPATHKVLSPEFCKDLELTDCAAGGNLTAFHQFYGVRWCSDAGTLANCQRKKIGNFIYAKHLGTTQTITCPVGTYCNATQNEGNINVSAVYPGGGTITNITIGGVSVISGPITIPANATASDAAGLITNAIQGFVSSPDFLAAQTGANVTVTKAVAGASGAGAAIVVTPSQIGTTRAAGTVTVSSTSPPGSQQKMPALTLGSAPGVNLLCFPPSSGSDIDFGNNVKVRKVGSSVCSSGCIEAASGTNSTSKRTSMRNAIIDRVSTCAVNAYSASQGLGDIVNILAPVSLGASQNGLGLFLTSAVNLTNITTVAMAGGASSPAVSTSVANMSGGRDAIANGVTLAIRKGVGSFSRTDIVPSNNIYAKGTGRTDCAGSTCSYADEMTNFANWYAYYRTRIQMMKTSVGRAFIPVIDTYRVGFITICPVSGNDCSNTTTGTTGISVDTTKYLKINDFTTGAGGHKQAWYTKFYAQTTGNYTPLREALSRVGMMFAGQWNASLTGGLSAAQNDPLTASCQPNFAILSTDGYWNGGPGRQTDGATLVGNQDNVNSGYSSQTSGAYDGGTPVASDTLADVAMYYYKTDLRTSGSYATDNVPVTNKDGNSQQHMVTFTLGLGLDGSLSYRPDYESASTGDFFDIKQGTKKWPVPVADSPTALDDLWHAAVNGRGVFFSAKNPAELATGLADTLNQLQARVGAGAAAATSNLQPVAGDNFAFTAQYQTSDWIGDLKARTIDLSTGIVSSVQLWSAAALIDGTVHTSRNIYTYDPTDVAGNKLKHFCWPGSGGTNCSDGSGLDATEQGYFNTNLLPQWTSWNNPQRTAATGHTLVDYVRGDGTHEDSGQSLSTDLYRQRISLLGDIVNAQPAYVKRSPFSYADTGYAGFKACADGVGTSCNATQFPDPSHARRGTVYAASNDGMLHAFETDVNNNPYYQTAGIATAATTDDAFTGNNTGNGVERWAYIPRFIMPSLYRLASDPYSHRYLADGSPTVGDICVSTPCAGQNDWRTIMVAGVNSGGYGYYALDISNPLAPKALWEFTNSATCSGVGQTSDCNLGDTYGNPVITKRPSDGKWVVIVTSGYNNNINGGNGQGYFYILDAVTGQILNRISTGVGTAASPSGLAKINGWTDNGAVDNTTLAVYGGDLEGNLWRLDLATNVVTRVATVVDASSNRQPITVKPELGFYAGKRIIMFGTGKFLETTDKTGPFTTQTIYALRDEPTVSTSPIISNVRSSTLVKVRGFAGGYNPATDTSRTVTTGTAPSWATEYGWLVDLPDTGERVNVDPVLQLGTLVVASNVPTSDTCTAGGYSWLNFLDYATGSYVQGMSTPMTGTKIASSVTVGLNVIMLPGGKVETIVTTADNQQLTKDTPVPPTAYSGRRVSWRELYIDR